MTEKTAMKGLQSYKLAVNEECWEVVAEPSNTLLHVLREHLGLTGAKPGCENGDCGACTILIDGIPKKSCLVLALEAVGHDVTTVEGLKNTPIQEAFLREWAFQCGYCTSGFLMVGHALATTHPDADENGMTEWLQSNICRCTGYQEITEATRSVLQG